MAFTRIGYGQVEPNQLSAQKTGQIYASLPLDTAVDVLQNGEFMYYDYQTGKVSATDSTEPFWRTSYKDFAMIRVNHTDPTTGTVTKGENYVTSDLATQRYGDGADNVGVAANPAHTEYPYRMDGFAPRLFKTNIGDIMTTNMVKTGSSVTYAVGDKLVPVKNTTTNTLQLEKDNTATTGMIWVVVKVYTMPDGQDGLKLQRVH